MEPDDLRRCLAALHWSQRELADVLSVSEGYVSQMLSGAAPIPPWIAAALDAAVDAKLGVGVSNG